MRRTTGCGRVIIDLEVDLVFTAEEEDAEEEKKRKAKAKAAKREAQVVKMRIEKTAVVEDLFAAEITDDDVDFRRDTVFVNSPSSSGKEEGSASSEVPVMGKDCNSGEVAGMEQDSRDLIQSLFNFDDCLTLMTT